MKALTAIKDVTLISLGGPGIVGVPDVVGRTFSTTAEVHANVLLISQSSSQNDICFIVASTDAKRTVDALRKEFAQDVAHEKVEHITVDPNIAIVAVVGENMRGTPGVAGRVFIALGQENVNIIAIAQGSSESNISFVVAEQDMKAALVATHREFGLGATVAQRAARDGFLKWRSRLLARSRNRLAEGLAALHSSRVRGGLRHSRANLRVPAMRRPARDRIAPPDAQRDGRTLQTLGGARRIARCARHQRRVALSGIAAVRRRGSVRNSVRRQHASLRCAALCGILRTGGASAETSGMQSDRFVQGYGHDGGDHAGRRAGSARLPFAPAPETRRRASRPTPREPG